MRTIPDLRLDAFTIPVVPKTCERPGRQACSQTSGDDITRWCFPCFRKYIRDLKAGNDWMGGIDPATRQHVCGFFDHPESLEVISVALKDIIPFGPWFEPTDEQRSELASFMESRT